MSHRTQSLHILIVDDDAMLRILSAAWLPKMGHQITSVDSGPAALAAIERSGDLLHSRTSLHSEVVRNRCIWACDMESHIPTWRQS